MPIGHLYVLLGLFLFHQVHNILWLSWDLPIPIDYKSLEYLQCADIFSRIPDKSLARTWTNILYEFPKLVYPPGYYVVSSIVFAVGRSVRQMIFFSNLPYWLLLLFSLYELTRHLVNRKTAILAVLLLSFYPTVYGPSRLFAIQFAAMSITVLGLLFLLKTECFMNRRFSILFGLTVAWLFLTKWECVIFIAGPLSLSLFRAMVLCRRDRARLRSCMVNVGLLCVLSLVIVTPLIVINKDNVYGSFISWQEYGNAISNWRAYSVGLWEYQLGLIYAALFMAGSFILLVSSPVRSLTKLYLFSWILIPWLILSTMKHQAVLMYSLPYIPAVALISAIGLRVLIVGYRWIVGLVLVVGLTQYYAFSFGLGPPLDELRYGDIHYYRQSNDICRKFCRRDPRIERILALSEKIASSPGFNKAADRVLLLPLDPTDVRFPNVLMERMAQYDLLPIRIDFWGIESLQTLDFNRVSDYKYLVSIAGPRDYGVHEPDWLSQLISKAVQQYTEDDRHYMAVRLSNIVNAIGIDRIKKNHAAVFQRYGSIVEYKDEGVVVRVLKRNDETF